MSSTKTEPLYRQYVEHVVHEKSVRDHQIEIESIRRASAPQSPFFSVVMRTQAKRPHLMEQALLCLVAQECEDFEVVIVAHNVESADVNTIQNLVDGFGVQLHDRVTIVAATGGLRGVPLNVGIDQARGDYVAFLDDDDLVFAHWLSEFKQGAEAHSGKIIRSRCFDRFVKNIDDPEIPSYVESGLIDARARKFSLTQHFFISQTVLHSYVVPRQNIIEAESYFDESYPVVEDWDFLLRNAELWGVVDTDSLTCVYNRWTNGGSSLHEHEASTWAELHNQVFRRFDERGLLIGPAELENLYRIWIEHERFKNIAAPLLKQGDGLMINKRDNALSRSVQYAHYNNTDAVVMSRRNAVKVLIKSVVPQRLHKFLRRLVDKLSGMRRKN